MTDGSMVADTLLLETGVARSFEASSRVQRDLLPYLLDATVACVTAIVDCFARGGRVWLVGNGGSAAAAQHFAAELSGRFRVGSERRPLPVASLTTDTAVLTAIANDFGVEHIFARQVSALARRGDIVVAISVSGRSPNILMAAEAARASGAYVVALTSAGGDPLVALADTTVQVSSVDTPRVQEIHGVVLHAIAATCDLILDREHKTLESPYCARNTTTAHKVTTIDALLAEREMWRQAKRRLVWTNGCFDIVHVGHIRFLQASKQEGEVLVVGINSDESVRRLKGSDRPFIRARDRAEILAALECVDRVVIFTEDTPVAAISRLKPDVHCKGDEYAPPSGRAMPEADVVRAYGGRVVFVPLVDGAATTAIVDRIRERR